MQNTYMLNHYDPIKWSSQIIVYVGRRIDRVTACFPEINKWWIILRNLLTSTATESIFWYVIGLPVLTGNWHMKLNSFDKRTSKRSSQICESMIIADGKIVFNQFLVQFLFIIAHHREKKKRETNEKNEKKMEIFSSSRHFSCRR